MKSQFDRDPVPTLDTQNQSAVRQLTDSDKVSGLKNVGTMQHEKYTDAQARYDAQNIIDAETLSAGSSDAAVRNIMADLSADVTPIDDDISALYESTGNASVFPRKVNRYVTVNGNRVDLDNQQYSDWQRDAGQLSYDLAEQIVGSSMTDDQKAKYLSDAYSFAMAYTANDLFDSSLSSTLNKEVEIYNDGGSDLLANWYYLKAMGDGSPSQEETKAILDKMNISRAEKAILWEQTNSSWKTNPYK